MTLFKSLLLVFVIFAIGSCSVSIDVKRVDNDTDKKPVVVGEHSPEEWQKKVDWENFSAVDYQPNQKKIEKLQNLLQNKDVSFIIFTTSYCDVCELHVPRLLKILKLSKVTDNKIKLIGMDKNLEEPTKQFKLYEIKAVPTLVILYKNKLHGKIEPPDLDWLEYLIEYMERIK